MITLIEDVELHKAVSRIPLRSEKEKDKAKLLQSFVDTGILVQLHNQNSQIFYGRRGTGKTHVLQVLAQTINQENNSFAIYVDMRTLGSNTQTDNEREPAHNSILLFKDLLAEVHSAMLERAVSDVGPVTAKGYNALDELANVTTKVASVRINEKVVDREKTTIRQ